MSKFRVTLGVLAGSFIACGGALAQVSLDEEALPRSLTEAEREMLKDSPLRAVSDRGGVPSGDVRCIAEYEPMEGILMAYEGSSGWKLILEQMSAQITTVGNANAYMICDTSGEANTARSRMIAAGADPARVFTFVRTTDSIWMRDYGPRYIYEDGIRAIVDHTYNRPRPSDNVLPDYWSSLRGEPQYQIPLVHGGGNYHLDALGFAYSTRLIANENPGLSEAAIVQLWRDYQNLETELTDPLPANVDSTQHIDMWMQVISDDAVVISDFPLASGSTHDQVCDSTAALLQSLGYTVHRVPAIGNPGQTHFTFTNVVMCNDLVLLPFYDAISRTYNSQALATWQAALPSKTIVQIDCDAIVTAAGVMHCIVMHVPQNLNGENPTVFLIDPNGGVTYEPGDFIFPLWKTDDDLRDIQSIDVLLSTDGGATFNPLATGLPDIGSAFVTVPDVFTTEGVLRVVAIDGDGNTGFDDTDMFFSINGTVVGPVACNPADLNDAAAANPSAPAFGTPDGLITPTDFSAFSFFFSTGDLRADINDAGAASPAFSGFGVPDGLLTPTDFSAFAAYFGAGCPCTLPGCP